jgi:hypothetical protein
VGELRRQLHGNHFVFRRRAAITLIVSFRNRFCKTVGAFSGCLYAPPAYFPSGPAEGFQTAKLAKQSKSLLWDE